MRRAALKQALIQALIHSWLVCALLLHATSSAWAADVQADVSRRCSNMARPHEDIVDAATIVTSAGLHLREGAMPAYCELTGYIAPHQEFELRLPTTTWNGKYAQVGCGGACGSPVTWLCDDLIRRGYACMAPDLGHFSGDGQDRLWARNNLQAQIDFGFRGVHVASIAGKTLAERFYGKPPRLAYFMGGSTGGRLGLILAQRFPWDFNGIIAGMPVLYPAGTALTTLWIAKHFNDQNGYRVLPDADVRLLHDAVLKRCEMNDGVKDGLIGDPRDCDFDAASLLCKGAKTVDCLSTAQLTAVQKIYAGPKDSAGRKLFFPAMMLGSELEWINGYYNAKRFEKVAADLRNAYFLPAAGSDWKGEDFNWDVDYKRLDMAESFSGAANPDLRRAKTAGVKIIMMGAWADEAVFPAQITDYYDTVSAVLGGVKSTQDFFRLFMIPGRNHAGGNGAADSVDWLSYLETWVEQGMAPDVIVGARLKSNTPSYDQVIKDGRVEKSGLTLWFGAGLGVYSTDLGRDADFTRPIFPYPLRTRYKGGGDVNDWRSYTAAPPRK